MDAHPSRDASHAKSPGDDTTRRRLYDSFIVRLWHDAGERTMLRGEVEHVQAGLFLEEMDVPLEWIVSAIESCLKGPELPEEGHGDGQRDGAEGEAE